MNYYTILMQTLCIVSLLVVWFGYAPLAFWADVGKTGRDSDLFHE